MWRSQFSSAAAAPRLLDLTVPLRWLTSRSFHRPPKREECYEVPMVNHIHIYILDLIKSATRMGEAVRGPTNGAPLKNHNGSRGCKKHTGKYSLKVYHMLTHSKPHFDSGKKHQLCQCSAIKRRDEFMVSNNTVKSICLERR